jgi:hypothetical protein
MSRLRHRGDVIGHGEIQKTVPQQKPIHSIDPIVATMSINIGINGFGRIGRYVVRV